MLVFSSILVCFITLLGVKFEFDNKSPFVIFFLALILMSVFPTLSTLFNFDVSEFRESTYIEANLFSSLFLGFLIFSRYFIVRLFGVKNIWFNFIRDSQVLRIRRNDILILSFLLFLAILFFIKGLNIRSFSSLMSVNWWDVVNGGVWVILATYICYISSSVLIANYLYKGNGNLKFLVYIQILFFLIFCIFVLKTRSYILMILAPIFCYFMYTKKGLELVKPIFYLFLMLFVFILARAVRHSSDLNEFLESDFLEGFELASEGAENTLINGFYYFVQNNNNFNGFENNNTLKRVFLFAFPSLKPEEFSYIMHSAYYGSNPSDRLSIHPTVYGDAYGNAWWFGAFIYSLFIAFYISFLEITAKFINKSSLYKLCVFSIICTCSLIFARGAIYNAFMYSFIPLFFIFLFLNFSQLFLRESK